MWSRGKGQTIASGGPDGRIQFWDVLSGAEQREAHQAQPAQAMRSSDAAADRHGPVTRAHLTPLPELLPEPRLVRFLVAGFPGAAARPCRQSTLLQDGIERSEPPLASQQLLDDAD
jgi:hypothetical protein